jgi:cysteine desulfurase
MTLFLDANAHLPLHPKAIQAFVEYNNGIGGHGHPMSHGKPGRTAAEAMETAREKIAQLIGAKNRNQIVFTSTATQACEWGLELMHAQGFDKVYTTTVEHKSVAIKARQLFGNNDLFINKEGVVSCAFQPPEKNAAFVCVHVQNEIGTIQTIEDIQVPFFSDMSQSLGKIPVNVSNFPNLKVAVFGAHKFGGPPGVGILYLQDERWWKAFGTGSRYLRDRPGTPDVGMVIATSVALEHAIKTLPARYERALSFRSVIESALNTMQIEILGVNASRVPHTTFMQVGGRMGPYIMTQMEAENVYVGLGSACGSLSVNSNPTATALGYGGKAQDYMRISQWGDYGEREGRKVAETLFKYCPKPERKS